MYVSGDPSEQMVDDDELIFSTIINPWTNTQNNRSNKSCETNIGYYVMNIKMLFLWKRQMFNMQQSDVDGIPRGQLIKLNFKS